MNLVIGKNHHLEVLSVTPEGLRSVKNFNINGRVEAMKFFRPQGKAKDRLFIVTSRHNAMILGCNCAVKMLHNFLIISLTV